MTPQQTEELRKASTPVTEKCEEKKTQRNCRKKHENIKNLTV